MPFCFKAKYIKSVAVLRVSSPLKLRKTSYVHCLVEKIEEEEEDDELEAIESRNRSAWKKKKYIQLELKKNWKENNLWKKKKILMQCFESLPSSDGSYIITLPLCFCSLWETAIKVTLFRTQEERVYFSQGGCWVC